MTAPPLESADERTASVSARPAAAPSSDRHVPELDGLRGLAVLLTFAIHWQQGVGVGIPFDDSLRHLARLGWWGVEVFFVLSGFLITGILLRARESSPTFGAYLGRFMWRRALRIFPLYYAALIVLFVIVPRVVQFRDPSITTLLQNQPWYWLYAVNWLRAIHGDHSTPFATAHFWSLGVEEQFYLVWPMLVWVTGRRHLPWLACALWATSIALRAIVGPDVDPGRTATPLHFDPLMAGALVAWCLDSPYWDRAATWLRRACLPLVAALAVVSWQRNWFVLTSLTAAAVLVCLLTLRPTHPARVTGRSAVLRMFGKYSYCLYVVHYPLMLVLDRALPRLHLPVVGGSTMLYGAVYALALVGASLAISMASWRYFEAPILRWKDAIERPRRVGTATR